MYYMKKYRPRHRLRADVYSHHAWQTLTKVPKLTIYFWIIKILTTAMGEASSDFLVQRFTPDIAVTLGGLGLILALLLQFKVRKYIAAVYWLAAAAVSVTGTMAADVLHVGFGIPYIVSASSFAIILAFIFIIWYASEKTLSIHSIYTRKRECFYWATVMATFALGTATGDLTASTFGLGFLSSGILFAILFAIPGLAYWRYKINPILAFWCAYILTRPLGASFADWTSKPHSIGGLGFGDGTVSLALTIILVLFVGYLTLSRKDLQSQTQNSPVRSTH
jgi:uncharacterized membrane-anchored protein